MSDELGENSTVSFTVKELLTEQTSLLREISTKVDGKADKADLIPIQGDIRSLGGRVQTIEDERKAESAVGESKRATRRRAWAFTAAVLVPVTTTCIFVFH